MLMVPLDGSVKAGRDVERARAERYPSGMGTALAQSGSSARPRWMARAGRELLADADALVPVPLHWRRLWARRFNQSAALAKIVSRASGIAIADGALQRVKATAQQVGLTASERALNVQGAFAVP